jgi:hypothetical protein
VIVPHAASQIPRIGRSVRGGQRVTDVPTGIHFTLDPHGEITYIPHPKKRHLITSIQFIGHDGLLGGGSYRTSAEYRRPVPTIPQRDEVWQTRPGIGKGNRREQGDPDIALNHSLSALT